MLFRKAHQREKQQATARCDDIFVSDFLDNAADVKRTGGWTVTKDVTQNVSVLRSRVWPGFISYHRANSQVFGNFYLGSGIRNTDLFFMI